MFKNMRVKEMEMSKSRAEELLQKCDYGVLSTIGQNNYCYGIPLNYVYMDNSIYFHCALVGHKLENIEYNNNVSFCVVGRTEILSQEFDTKYESTIVFGKAVKVDEEEKKKVLIAILDKYSPKFKESGLKYLDKHINATRVIKISIDKISGKGSY